MPPDGSTHAPQWNQFNLNVTKYHLIPYFKKTKEQDRKYRWDSSCVFILFWNQRDGLRKHLKCLWKEVNKRERERQRQRM